MTIMLSLLLAAASPPTDEAQQVIANSTTNPSAVQFKNLHEGDGVICGEFNAPNKSGGYEGFEPFVYSSKERWGTGLLKGLVMVDGELTNLGQLWYDDNRVWEYTTGLKAYRQLMRRCSSGAGA